ncbi:MAG TPA: NADH-quinone oxidoreductase subunit D [Mycobacteriales bacterium]|nr:NADH-quinone oxidoreductase subunit D [Mycobacteriales bacterium]
MSTSTGTSDPYAGSRDTTEGRIYTVTGGDWDEVLAGDALEDDRLVVNMGPQHPSTHGVLRVVLEIEGETVTDARGVVGYLHTGIEKNCEFRTWTQAVTFLTRADYLSPLFNETNYCLAVEKLLGIEPPPRATALRVIMMELNRISSHLVWLATGGNELGATTPMTDGFMDRERILDIFEMTSGLRMNTAYVRPGGVSQDLPADGVQKIRELVPYLRERVDWYEGLLTGQPVFYSRLKDVAVIDVPGALAMGLSGPMLRAAGLPWDLRKTMPYCGYETYDFEVPTKTEGDCFARYLVRMEEMRQSCNIIDQALDRLEPGPVMVEDKKIAWPAQLALGGDGLGNSLDHVRHIMGQSMEALIHHFKLVTEGFRVPVGQVYSAIESPRGELGCHLVSDGGTRPFRVHVREPSFISLQSIGPLVEGGMIGDAIVAIASLDPVMGGCDR